MELRNLNLKNKLKNDAIVTKNTLPPPKNLSDNEKITTINTKLNEYKNDINKLKLNAQSIQIPNPKNISDSSIVSNINIILDKIKKFII